MEQCQGYCSLRKAGEATRAGKEHTEKEEEAEEERNGLTNSTRNHNGMDEEAKEMPSLGALMFIADFFIGRITCRVVLGL